jgi:hypothetical protein
MYLSDGYVRNEKFLEQVTMIGASSDRRPLPLMNSPPNVMRNVERYIRDVLSPWMKNNFKIVSVGGGESSNSSFPHISKKT